MEQHSENHILKLCLKGDPKGQRALYEKYKTAMFRMCLRYSRDRPEAEDLLQDGFIKVFQDLPKFRNTGALGGWIRRVILNVALQHVRKKKDFFIDMPTEQIPENFSEEINEYQRLDAKVMTQILQELPTGYRTVFNLYVIEGYTHKEIGEILSISPNTSKSQLHKSKALLRRMLEKIITV